MPVAHQVRVAIAVVRGGVRRLQMVYKGVATACNASEDPSVLDGQAFQKNTSRVKLLYQL